MQFEVFLGSEKIVITLCVIRSLRIGELKLAWRNFRDTAKRRPVGQRQ
jgi:hypothetical protein